MHLTESQIRSIISELILEGFKDDQRYLQEKYPENATVIGSLGPKYIAWLIARYGERPSREEIEPIRDAIVTIENFARKDAGIGEKYRASEQFRAAIDAHFPPDRRSWVTPNDITGMTINDLVIILGLSERKKQRFDVAQADDIEGDRVGKVGPWNLWMPTTRERSCEIAQYDPVTREPKTNWCTTRMAGSNLFYSYIGRPGEDIILFYIIKDNPKEKEDWISLGFVDGKPALKSVVGGLSLDRDGDGMTPKRFKSIFGPYYDEILNLLKKVVKDLEGTHPARQKIKDAGQDPEVLKYLTRGLSRDEASEITAMVLSEPSVSSEILSAHINDDNTLIQRAVAENPMTPRDILKRLASSENWIVRLGVAKNPSTPDEILVQLEEYDDMNWVRGAARSNLKKRNLAESSLRNLISRLLR